MSNLIKSSIKLSNIKFAVPGPGGEPVNVEIGGLEVSSEYPVEVIREVSDHLPKIMSTIKEMIDSGF
jgi:hypothetical protein